MPFRTRPAARTAMSLLRASLCALALAAVPATLSAQTVEDGSEAAIGPEATRAVLALIARHLDSPDAKVSVLRKAEGGLICGSVDVKNKMGLYSGARGFVADLSDSAFGRVPDGPELLSAGRGPEHQALERIRQLYFKACLD